MLFTFSCLVLCCGKLGTFLCQYLTVNFPRDLDIGVGLYGAVARGMWIFTSEGMVLCVAVCCGKLCILLYYYYDGNPLRKLEMGVERWFVEWGEFP